MYCQWQWQPPCLQAANDKYALNFRVASYRPRDMGWNCGKRSQTVNIVNVDGGDRAPWNGNSNAPSTVLKKWTIHGNYELIVSIYLLSECRAEQFDRKQAAAKKFNASFRESTGWIENQLRKIDQMGPVARDVEQLKKQIREIKVHDKAVLWLFCYMYILLFSFIISTCIYVFLTYLFHFFFLVTFFILYLCILLFYTFLFLLYTFFNFCLPSLYTCFHVWFLDYPSSLLQPFQGEVKDYKPNVDENWRFGTVYDRLISETEDTINTRTHARSTEIDVTKPIDARPPTYATPDYIEDSKME